MKKPATPKSRAKPAAKPKKSPSQKPSPKTTKRAAKEPAASGGERLNKYLSGCGICSRREADRWIAEGRIAINGRRIQPPGEHVQPGDIVTVDGKPVEPVKRHTYILYNKPKGLLCSRRDDKGRPLIYDGLDIGPAVQSIGRLDMDSEGALLLTDDGELARALTHPSAELPRQYRVRITGQPTLETLAALRSGGIDIGEGEKSDPWEVVVDSEARGHSWLTVTIRRGRWREVRRTLEAVGHTVRRLLRTRFGPIKLDEGMPSNSWRTLKVSEVRRLKDSAKAATGKRPGGKPK